MADSQEQKTFIRCWGISERDGPMTHSFTLPIGISDLVEALDELIKKKANGTEAPNAR